MRGIGGYRQTIQVVNGQLSVSFSGRFLVVVVAWLWEQRHLEAGVMGASAHQESAGAWSPCRPGDTGRVVLLLRDGFYQLPEVLGPVNCDFCHLRLGASLQGFFSPRR